jgi:hypothetical protein
MIKESMCDSTFLAGVDETAVKENLKKTRLLTKDDLVHLATNLYEEAFWANSYWNLLQQIHNQIGNYYEEIDISPCFYNLIHNALVKSMLMELAKLYDTDGISLQDLLTAIKPSDNDIHPLINTSPIKHCVSDFDAWYFKNDINKHHEICDLLKRDRTYPVVELGYKEYYEYLLKQLCAIKKSRKKLREQRNNALAHNGEDYKFDLKTLNEKFPIVKKDVDSLIKYALELTTFVVENLTGVSKPETSIDIDDWNRTLELVREGQRAIDQRYDEEIL